MTPRFSNHITSVVAKKLIVSMGSSRIYLTKDYTQGAWTKKEQFVKDRTLSVDLLQDIRATMKYNGTEFNPLAPRVNQPQKNNCLSSYQYSSVFRTRKKIGLYGVCKKTRVVTFVLNVIQNSFPENTGTLSLENLRVVCRSIPGATSHYQPGKVSYSKIKVVKG